MADQDIFGLPTTPIEEDAEKYPWLSEEDPAVPTDAPEAETQEPPAEPEITPEDPAAAPEVTEEAPAEEQTTEEQETEVPDEEVKRLYAGKYTSTEDLEKGYRELRDLWRRTSERAKVYEQQNLEILNKARELEMTLRQVMPIVQQSQAVRPGPPQPQFDEYGNPAASPPAPSVDPRVVQAYIDRQVAEKMQKAQEQMRASAAQAAERAAAIRAVKDVYERHGIEEDSELDNDIVETIRTFSETWQDGSLDLTNPDSIEIAIEATNRPALRQVLELHPEYVDTDTGMELARFSAALLEGNAITQQTSVKPASEVGRPTTQRKPAVERAVGGSDSGSIDPSGDPWLEALAAHRANPNTGSVFFE